MAINHSLEREGGYAESFFLAENTCGSKCGNMRKWLQITQFRIKWQQFISPE